ncbi:undecaprenyl-diphosphate phosphatase [Ruminococcus sp. OA3]|uniref:undecaprenyl-diphosphate phosphatase n=1 Tax=Ruminococcus sp. OA3 TaxID=2914164 RepID=UPI001F064766|nr:undecaprenyl-diphosphate phosphatase [Ruminococcus sp. OA3]MCH1983385.1 undecaprenyl-diphosphate phosphatase [Ruminococcus sp. OA3]
MSLLQAILMGIIQGCTEFLPVSSFGHLSLMKQVLHMQTDTGILFDVMLHVGTLTAVFVAFWADIRRLFWEMIRMIRDLAANGQIYFQNLSGSEERRYQKIVHNNYRKFIMMIFISTIPTVIIGVLMNHLAVQAAGSLLAVGTGLYITSVMLLVVDYSKEGKKLPREVGYGYALLIGVCQGIAVFPGISRSGVTIAACLLCGFHKKFSVKYSFIMSIPAVIGAAVWELRELPKVSFNTASFFYGLAGVVTAAVVGFFCIKIMLHLIKKSRFRFFALYCFLIGTTAIICNYVL